MQACGTVLGLLFRYFTISFKFIVGSFRFTVGLLYKCYQGESEWVKEREHEGWKHNSKSESKNDAEWIRKRKSVDREIEQCRSRSELHSVE